MRRSPLAYSFRALLPVLFFATAGSAFAAPNGVQFNGTNQYITFGQATSTLGASTFTIEVWFRREGTGAVTSTGTGANAANGLINVVPLLAKGRGQADGTNVDCNYFLGFRTTDNVLVADYEDFTASNNNHAIAGTTPILNNTWYHAAATYDGTNFKLYLNGNLEAQVATSAQPRFDSIQHASLASALTSTPAAAGFFAGILDEARIWSVGRTQQQIIDNMFVQITDPTTPNLLGRWALDETSGTNAPNTIASPAPAGTLTFTGTPATNPIWVSGSPFALSYALKIAGGSGYANMGNPAALKLPQFTLETWFRRDAAGVGTNTGSGGIPDLIPLIAKGRADAEEVARDINYIFGIRASDNLLCADFEEGVGGDSLSLNHPVVGRTPIPVNANLWHHAAVTYDGVRWRLFLDGNLERDTLINEPAGSGSDVAVSLGSALTLAGAASGFFNGVMDEVRIWDHARLPADIIADRNAQILTPRTGLVARWGLDEGAGTTIHGSAGTTIDGQLVSTNWSWALPAPFNLPAPPPPAAPTGLGVTAQTFAAIRVQWADNASNEAGYEIQRSTTGIGGPYTTLFTTAPNATSYVDATVSENTQYCYQVRAFNFAGNSNFAGPLCATTPVETNQALGLAGTNAYVDLGNPSALDLAQFTLECWFRRDGAGVGTDTGNNGVPDVIPLIARGRAQSEDPDLDINYILGIRANDGRLVADFEEGAAGGSPSQNHPVVGDAVIGNGVWHHAAVTYDATRWRLYLDGNLERDLLVGEPVASASQVKVALGSALNGNDAASGFFQGLLDEVRIWNYARTVTEIQGTINNELETPQTGLVGRWGLNEGALTQIHGGAGTGLDGNVVGSGFSWSATGAPFNVPAPTAPAAPSDLAATPLTEGQIQLAWQDHSNNELTFEIQRSTTGVGGPYTPLVSVTANTLTYIDTGLAQLTNYCYRVRAVNNVAPSSYATPRCATTPAEPNKALDLGGTDAYVAFGDPTALHLPEFTLECWFRRDGAGVTANTGEFGVLAVPLVTKGVAEDDGSTRDMNFFLGIRGTDGVLVADFEEGALGTTPGVNHPVIGATPVVTGTWYHAAATYDGTKWRLFLNGNLERELSVGEPPQYNSIQRAALGSAVSSTGAIFGFFDGAIDEVRIWDHARTPAEILLTINESLIAAQTGLEARWGLNEGTGTLVHSSAGTTVPGTVTGLNYTWIDGAPFNVPAPTAPNAPTGLLAQALSHTQIQLDWTDNSNNELAFEIERSVTGPLGTYTPLATVGANVRTYVDGGLTELTEYCYRVRATNTVAPSGYTENRCQTTPVEVNRALGFGGTDAYVSFGHPAELGLQQFTIETWFRRDGPGISSSTGTGGVDAIPLVTHGTGEVDNANNLDTNWYLGIHASLNVLVADFEEASDGATPGLNHPVIGSTPLQNGVWYHAAATYGADGTWRLYLNGTLETELFVGENPRWDSVQPAALGSALQSDGTPEGFFNGLLDEVRVWDHARIEADLQAALNSQIKTTQTGLVARWGLNEGAGTQVGASAGTTANGVIQGTNFAWAATGAPFNIVIQHSPDEPGSPTPAHQATQVSTSPTLSVTPTDQDGGNLTVTFYGRAVAGAAGADFTLIGLPDTQFYVSSLNGGTPGIFDSQTNWIVANKTARNIVDVVQLGDCVEHGDNNGNNAEWVNADHSMKIIENPQTTGLQFGLPYGICVGNHDQSPIGDAAGTTMFYNQFFGSSRFAGRPYYGGHFGSNNDNHFHLFSASGLNFIVISFEYDTAPDAGVLHWADSLLTFYSNRRAIIASHYIINSGNPGTFGPQGQAIYNALRAHPNLFLMLSGHVSPPEGRRVDTFNGNTVYSVMSDYQSRAQGGTGWLRIYEFSPANNVIRVRTYTPWLNQFEADADSSSQFTIPYDMGGGAPFVPISTQVVASGTPASFLWSGRSPAAQYDWYVTVSDGNRTVTSDTWRFTTIDNANPTVTVTSPNGGESWVSGTHHNITWTASDNNTVDSVYIALSTNGGSTYPNEIVNAIPNTGTYDWVVPPTVGNTMRVRVTARDPSHNVGSDASNANFTITDGTGPTVTLTAPDGGESWAAGSTQTITWNATDNVAVTTVDLAYSTNGGASFPNVIATGIANTGTRSWTLPNIATSTARVRVIARDAVGNTGRDSSANFSIVDITFPAVALTSPNGGESWASGSAHNVTWNASDNVAVTAIDLKYSTDGGATFPNAIATGIANSGTFAWTVGGPAGANARVQIIARDAAGHATGDQSDGNFTITPEGTPPTVQVMSPNGGESWAAGTHHNITWTATDASGVASVDIALSSNGGSTYPTTIASGLANSGTYDWLIPANVGGTTLRIRVTALDTNGNPGNDASNANFTVTEGEPPSVTVTAPDGGESWDAGSSQTITWTATDNVAVTSVDLAYSTNGGTSFPNIIATGIANTGSRAWTVPSTLTSTARVRVIARDAAGNAGRDSSNANFSIVDATGPSVTVNSPNGGESFAAGSTQNITWTATDNVGVTAIDLKYSTDGGATFPNAIATGIPNTPSSRSWTVPNTVGTTLRVQAIAHDAAGHVVSDESNGNFSIVLDPDLVTNGGFESNIAGWGTYGNCALSLANEGHTGTHSMQIAASDGSSFGNDDEPNSVPAAGAVGTVYRVSAWVRSATGAPGNVKIRVYEFVGSSQQGVTTYSQIIPFPSTWTQLFLDYSVRTAGSFLSIKVTGSAGGTFLVDDISIKRVSPGAPPPDNAPVVTAPATVNAAAGVPLSFTVTASDADGPAIASLTQTGKPAAATFTPNGSNTSGTFTWTPTSGDVRTQAYVVTFTASNTKSGSATTSIFVRADRPPVVTAPATVNASPGVPLTFNVTASDPDGQAITSLAQSGKPAAATFTPNGSNTSGTFTWTPAAGDVRIQPYTVTFTASNALSGSATTNITVSSAPANLCGNPDFESGTNGWSTYGNAVLASVAGGRTGKALQVTGSGSFGTDDVPNWIPSPVNQGAVYRVSCYMKGNPGATGTVKIRVYEFLGSSQQGVTAYSQIVPLTSNWQQFNIDYTVRVQGTFLSVRFTDAASSTTESYLVDDVLMTQLSPGPALATATTFLGEPLRAQAAAQARGRTVSTEGPLRLGSTANEWVARIEGLPPEVEREIPAVALRVGDAEVASIFERTTLGEDTDGNGIEELAVTFRAADLARLLEETGNGTRDVEAAFLVRSGTAPAVETPFTLRVEGGPAAAFTASFAPNPAYRSAMLSFVTTRAGFARAEVFDARGRRVQRLLDDPALAAGTHRIPLGASGESPLPPGLYFYRIQAAEGTLSGRFVWMR